MSALPFGWVFSLFLKRKLPCLLFNLHMHKLIGKELKHYYILLESLNILLTWTYIVLDI